MSTATIDNEPKYRRLYVELRDQILSGELRTGERLPSVSTLLEERRVTSNTVDKAYHLLEQESLIERRQGKGIFVAAKKPVRTNRIGFSVGSGAGSCRDPFWMHLLAGIQGGAEAAGMRVLLWSIDWSNPRLDESVDGVIYVRSAIDSAGVKHGEGVPGICLFAPSSRVPSIVSDDFSGTAALTRHLIGHGHRRIAMLNLDNTWIVERRIDGYKAELNAAGIPFDEKLVRPIPSRKYTGDAFRFETVGRRRMEEWFATDWDELGCTAIIAQNDATAIGVIQACQEAGLRVPEDVSVAGFDGMEVGELVTPSITTVAIPLEKIGEFAVQTLLEVLEHGKAPFASIAFPTELVIRRSTGPVPR